jgi:site-specific DNA recombinase
VKIYVTTHDRLYDPANPRDRRSLLEDAVDSEYESAKISLRARRAQAAAAAEGRPNGRCPYGYQRLYDPHTGRLVKQAANPVEAAVVETLFERLYNGHSLRAIRRHFEREGIRTRNGKPFSEHVLREMALNPAYAGWRVHSPGHPHRARRLEDTTRYEAAWPALVARSTWLAVYHRLTAPERRTSKPGRGKHLLSMIAKCGVCDGPLAASYRSYGSRGNNKVRTYQCHAATHVRVLADMLDAYAEEAMLAWLARPDVHSEWTRDTGANDRLEQLRTELAEARVELDQLRAAATDRRITVETLLAVEPALAERVTALEAQEADLTIPPGLQPFLNPAEDAATAWRNAPMSARRELARLLLTPELLGELRLLKPPTKGVPNQGNQFTGALPVAYRTQFRGRDFTHGPEIPPARCTVDGCEKPYYGRGLCKKHHQREWLRRRQTQDKSAA